MKNVERFEETRKAVEVFKEKTEYLLEEAEEKSQQKGVFSKVYQKSFFKALQTMELSIIQNRDIITFDSPSIGSFIQPIHLRRNRINVVPLCAMVELYKDSIKCIPEAKDFEIPFTLKGFWKMDKAISCICDLYSLSLKSASKIGRLANYKNLREEQKELLLKIVEAIRNLQQIDGEEELLVKIIESAHNMQQFEGVDTKKYDGYTTIIYKDGTLKINTSNMKLNIVPFCKMVCKYYTEVIKSIDNYQDTLKLKDSKVQAIREEYTKFITKYFIPEKYLRI